MKFISTDKAMPDKNGGIFLLKAHAFLELKKEFVDDDHIVEVEIEFYILSWHVDYWGDSKISLNNSVITNIEIHCCTEGHKKKLQDWKINEKTVKKFIYPKNWHFYLGNIDYWINVHDLDIKDEEKSTKD